MNWNSIVQANLDESPGETWPEDCLESIAHCPVCRQTERAILHADLVDNTFRNARGKWSLWNCSYCYSAYLSPRPTNETIHFAYGAYYTHQKLTSKENYNSLSLIRRLRRRLVNGYTNWRYLTSEYPASSLGVLVMMICWPLKVRLDREYRNLPRPTAGGDKLLDVGCGDGSFLNIARTCGWDVVGLDSDPMAIANATGQGLTVHLGGIEYFVGRNELFDVITLNHVIEHVYDPVKVLEACYVLLKPGGRLWLETPNIDSFGYARFQRNWRGLEAPRHLVIFNRRSLYKAISNAGFQTLRTLTRPSACHGMFKASYAMAHGHSPYSALTIPKMLWFKAAIAVIAEIFLPSRREFLTVTARKEER